MHYQKKEIMVVEFQMIGNSEEIKLQLLKMKKLE